MYGVAALPGLFALTSRLILSSSGRQVSESQYVGSVRSRFLICTAWKVQSAGSVPVVSLMIGLCKAEWHIVILEVYSKSQRSAVRTKHHAVMILSQHLICFCCPMIFTHSKIFRSKCKIYAFELHVTFPNTSLGIQSFNINSKLRNS